MTGPAIACGKCRAPLPTAGVNRGRYSPCPRCGSLTLCQAFPALLRAPERGRPGEDVVLEGESTCFEHPAKRAVVPCGSCGRFLCTLCDLEIEGRHLCPACLESGTTRGRFRGLERRRVLWDGIALSLAVLPLVVWPFTLVTAPLALYIVVRFWRAPASLLPRTRARFVAAAAIAGAEIAGWLLLLAYAFG